MPAGVEAVCGLGCVLLGSRLLERFVSFTDLVFCFCLFLFRLLFFVLFPLIVVIIVRLPILTLFLYGICDTNKLLKIEFLALRLSSRMQPEVYNVYCNRLLGEATYFNV